MLDHTNIEEVNKIWLAKWMSSESRKTPWTRLVRLGFRQAGTTSKEVQEKIAMLKVQNPRIPKSKDERDLLNTYEDIKHESEQEIVESIVEHVQGGIFMLKAKYEYEDKNTVVNIDTKTLEDTIKEKSKHSG